MISGIRFTALSIKILTIYIYGFPVAEYIDCRTCIYVWITSRVGKAQKIFTVKICFTQFGNIGYRRCYEAVVRVIVWKKITI